MNAAPQLPFERLALVDDPVPRDAALNMALDEVLLDRLGPDPLLRIYRWKRPSVSIGYFEPYEAARQHWPGHDLVRRWTGGGIVEHGEDLTFSLLVPRSIALATRPAEECYLVVHTAVAEALSGGGHSPKLLELAPAAPAGPGSRACFERPVRHDLLMAGRKIAGGAQRRTRRGLLHQGSIRASFRSGLAAALPRVFGRSIHARTIIPAEIAAAMSLVETKYGTPAWRLRF